MPDGARRFTAVGGLILAGGRSRRMGQDKAVLCVEGERLIDRAIRVIGAVSDTVVVAAGPRRISGLDVLQVDDNPAGVGPIGGLIAGLRAIPAEVAVVLAVDVPGADLQLLRALVDRCYGVAAVIPTADGRPQPLHSVWRTAAAPALAALVDQGARSIIDTARLIGAVVVDAQESRILASRDDWAYNLNRPEDVPGGPTSQA